MSPFAEHTSVSVERSRAEIEQLLQRYGADQFISGWDSRGAMIAFRARGRQIRFFVESPDQEKFTTSPGGRRRNSAEAVNAAWQQESRRRWRALALVIKAKLEAVESGITDFEQEFLAHIVLPDGSTVGQWAAPQLEQVYQSGQMPSTLALPAPKERSR